MDYTERLATGAGITVTQDIDQLVLAGITHVIDMRAEFDDSTLNDQRVVVLWLPQQDDGTPRDPQQVWHGIDFALTSLSIFHKGKVFCHCAAGVNRGPLETYAILRAMGIPSEEAIDRIRTKRPGVNFYNVPNYILSVENALNA